MKNKSIFFIFVVSVFLIGNLFLISPNRVTADNSDSYHMMDPIHINNQDSDSVDRGFMHDGFMSGFGFMPGGIYGLLIILLVIVVLVLLVIYLIKKINEPVEKKEQKAENSKTEEVKESDKLNKEATKENKKNKKKE